MRLAKCTALILVIVCFITLRYFVLKKPNNLTRAAKYKDAVSYPLMYIAAVACGQKFKETITMIKSALIFNRTKDLVFLIFVEEQLKEKFSEKLIDWQSINSLSFRYQLISLSFPEKGENEWKNLFKPCAAQRLFLPSLLGDIDAILYVDTDILFLSPVGDLWNHFKYFNRSQIAGLSNEHEDDNIGWYKRYARHPFYGNLGLNSGVMLMNLTRMREFKWEDHILPIYKKYKLKITWGDQDLINILFYYYSEKVYIFPCQYNYRPDHCMYMNVCNISNGIKILHGNRGYFHSSKQPLFRVVYKAFENNHMGRNIETNIIKTLKLDLESKSVKESNCGKIRKKIFV